jgi:hypothetical protein
MNIDCASATVRMYDATDGEVYEETQSGIDNSGIDDYYQYCFNPVIVKPDLLFSGMPNYANGYVSVVIQASSGQTAFCGLCYVGNSLTVGDTQGGMQLGIQDYSVKSQDDFGNYTITERNYSRKVTMLINMESYLVDSVHNILSAYRALPAVYIGSTRYGASFAYGFYKDFNIEIPGPNYSLCSIEIEGLT